MIPRAELEFTLAAAEAGIRSEPPPEVMADLCRVYLASQWQPIETAPEDETPVIIYCGRWGEILYNYERRVYGPGNIAYEPIDGGVCCVRAATYWRPMLKGPVSE